jgi:streptogramin lyase
MNEPLRLTDGLLAEALSRRAAHSPSPMLLDRVVAAAATTPQEQAPWWARGGLTDQRSWAWFRTPALAGALATVLIVAFLASVVRPPFGPGSTPTPSPTPSTASTPAPATPQPVLLGESPALRLDLGIDAGPIDVIDAFGSIWIADIHANDVRRFDQSTMAELARIEVPGAAWFVVADDALWVTQQVGTGLTRIDPATNTPTGHVGDVPPCGAPAVALDSIWASACDANVFLRIDPATTTLAETIPAQGHRWVVEAGGELITLGSDGLARLDPESRTFTVIPGTPDVGGQLLGSDGETAWMGVGGEVLRINPRDGQTVATFPYSEVNAVTFSGGHAWLTVEQIGVVDIDLATNAVVRTIPLRQSPDIAREVDGVVWVSDFDNSDLWRIEP